MLIASKVKKMRVMKRKKFPSLIVLENNLIVDKEDVVKKMHARQKGEVFKVVSKILMRNFIGILTSILYRYNDIKE